ncbi:transcriptional regulator GabR [Klebsiella pneumoniae]|nr:transcriptional regulator GabR [Klebsiella pneumoniae]
MAIARDANARNILVRPLSRYYLTTQRKKGLLMGFASQPETQMEPAFNILLECLKMHCPQALAEAEKQNAPT